MKNDTTRFPKTLTAEMLRGFITTENGSTHPRKGEIDGCVYIAKCGGWSGRSSDEHVANELAADAFLRAAGFNVPASKEYRVDFGDGERVVRLSEFLEDAVPLVEAWERADEQQKARLREQVVAAYPAQAVIAGIDTFMNDNVLVDRQGELWFVDNGADFDFRARGERKGWFWSRARVDDPRSGYLSLARHRDQAFLRRLLGGVDPAVLWSAAEKADVGRYAALLPRGLARRELVDYIGEIARFAAEAVKNPPPPRTELVLVLDRSGSMGGKESDVIGGFNGLIGKQLAEKGECRVSTVLFDDKIAVLHDRVPLRDIGPMTTREYRVGGTTALLDALGGAVAHHVDVQRKLQHAEKADKVVFVVITDGCENASRRFNADLVRKLVRRQREEWGWEFIFLGANVDAVESARNFGMAADRAVDFVCDGAGLDAGYEAVNRAVANVRNRRRVEDRAADGSLWRDGLDRDYKARRPSGV